jgi:exodeoxyribonuclease-3
MRGLRVLSIATWNVNSIKQRLPHVREWITAHPTDILLLQEIKCQREAFPYLELEEAGYNIAVQGEKSYNGVAILSKFPLEDVSTSLPGDEADLQARYIEAVVSLPRGKAMRIASVYVPNGQDPESEKFPYKLTFLARLRAHFARLLEYEEIFVAGGDYNVAPESADVHDPTALEGSV